jgi:DNA-binding CsgD family transcriptional regulator
MSAKKDWIRADARVVNYIAKYVQTVGAQRREEVFELFDRMHRIFPHWVIATCPVMHPDIVYTSRNAMPVMGYTPEFLSANSKAEKFFELIHPSDQDDLLQCYLFMNEFLESMPPEQHPEYRCVFHYRFRQANGQYIYLHDEKASLKLDEEGNLYYGLFRDNTTDKPFTGVKAEIFRQDLSLVKIKEFKPVLEKQSLSRREAQLVTLIRQGLSTKEIAGYLSISHNTVRNIKSKLFEKYNVNNSIELLNQTLPVASVL